MANIKIQSGIPLPDKGYKGASLPNYPKQGDFPWTHMSVGDSFFIPCEDGMDIVRLMNRITGSAAAHVGPGCVSTRTVFEGATIGVRAWKIAELDQERPAKSPAKTNQTKKREWPSW